MSAKETERVTIPVTADRAAEVQSAAATLTRAEGKSRKPPDVGRNALVFYLRSVRACLTCQAGSVCHVHGTLALRPEAAAAVDEIGPSHADIRRVTSLYFGLFKETRGEAPAFGQREGKAVKDLVAAVGLERAESAIRSAFSDAFWKDRATICTIATDPSRHLGGAAPASAKRGSLQADSGFVGGEEVK